MSEWLVHVVLVYSLPGEVTQGMLAPVEVSPKSISLLGCSDFTSPKCGLRCANLNYFFSKIRISRELVVHGSSGFANLL